MNQYLEILFMFLKAFVIGGAICTVAQVFINYTKLVGIIILGKDFFVQVGSNF